MGGEQDCKEVHAAWKNSSVVRQTEKDQPGPPRWISQAILVRRELEQMFGNDHICYSEAIYRLRMAKLRSRNVKGGRPRHKARFGNPGLDSLIARYGLKPRTKDPIVCSAPTVF